MTKFLLTITLFATFFSYSQKIIEPTGVELSELPFIGSVYITSNGLNVFADAENDYQFDSEGKLVKKLRVKYKKGSTNSTIHSLRLNDFYNSTCFDKSTDSGYDIFIGNSPYSKGKGGYVDKTKYDPSIGIVTETVEFEDDLKPSRNLASAILNDYSPYSSLTCMDNKGNVVGMSLYMSISNSSHPGLANFDNNTFHTFVHMVKFDPTTQKIEITNHLIDKIGFQRTKGNSAYGELIGVVNNNVIIKYTTFKSEERKDLYDAIGNSSKRLFTYWAIDLETMKETQIYEYETSFPAEMVEFGFKDVIVGDKLVTDCAWTEKNGNGNGQGFISKHNVIVMDENFEFNVEEFFIPADLLTLAGSSPAISDFIIDKEGAFMMSNFVSEKIDKYRKLDYFFLYFKDENGEIELKKNLFAAGIKSIDGYKILLENEFSDEEFEQIYGQVRTEKIGAEFCKYCYLGTLTSARIIEGDLYVFSVERLMNGRPKEIKQYPPIIRIVKLPIEK